MEEGVDEEEEEEEEEEAEEEEEGVDVEGNKVDYVGVKIYPMLIEKNWRFSLPMSPFWSGVGEMEEGELEEEEEEEQEEADEEENVYRK